MAIQTLKTIKNWFKTGLKPTQSQFWDTWDSFRHKNEKIPARDIEGFDELLNESDFKTINGESIVGSGDIGIDGGGSQGLPEVLAVNPVAYDSYLAITNSTNPNQTSFMTSYMIGQFSDLIGEGAVELTQGKIQFYNPMGGGGVHRNASLTSSPITDDNPRDFILPLKNPGTYTLATIDDISGGDTPTLQEVITAENTGREDILLNKAIVNGIIIEKGHDLSSYRENQNAELNLSGLKFEHKELGSNNQYTLNLRGNYITNSMNRDYDSASLNSTLNPDGLVHSFSRGDTNTNGSLHVKQTLTEVYKNNILEFPLTHGTFTIPISVNGKFADENGNITVSGTGAQNLQSVLDNGSTATTTISICENSNGLGNKGTYMSNYNIGLYDNLRGFTTNIFPNSVQTTDGVTVLSHSANSLLYHEVASAFYTKIGFYDLTSNSELYIPSDIGIKTLPISVNGNFADINGNITIPGGSQNLQQVLNEGNVSTTKAIFDLNPEINDPYKPMSSISYGSINTYGAHNWYGEIQTAATEITSGSIRVSRNGLDNTFVFHPQGTQGNMFYAPNKSGGIYTLSTLEDLPNMVTASAAPISATDSGTKGEIRIDNNYVYICIATNTWKRSPLTTW
ncbi:hypothetical protein EV144_106248 [Flavobacterium sp. 270]|uniref:hypothetical protein n=1 Tax=Flavobacterium sp. 270 TaxID=2512114 RepID=UPI00106606B7|nr:hypothetical protein [Flavobacterium sp. 270]TDW46576.1 hypothetical protein EV144_106248 [Flavobacterium sp. 270]